LQRGRLGRGGLVLPLELLLLVERDLGDAGANGRGIWRRKAHALRVPARRGCTAAVLVMLGLGWEVLAPGIEDVLDQLASRVFSFRRLDLGLRLTVAGLGCAKNGRREAWMAGGSKVLDGGGSRRGLCLLL
jgi:hypothetical protein